MKHTDYRISASQFFQIEHPCHYIVTQIVGVTMLAGAVYEATNPTNAFFRMGHFLSSIVSSEDGVESNVVYIIASSTILMQAALAAMLLLRNKMFRISVAGAGVIYTLYIIIFIELLFDPFKHYDSANRGGPGWISHARQRENIVSLARDVFLLSACLWLFLPRRATNRRSTST